MKKIYSVTCLLLTAASLGMAQQSRIVGEHDGKKPCLGTAGYTWSEVRADCIRIWEVGVKLHNQVDKDSCFAGYIVFSSDGEDAELFLAENGDNHPILKKSDKGWTGEEYRLIQKDGALVLYKKDQLIYASKKLPNPDQGDIAKPVVPEWE